MRMEALREDRMRAASLKRGKLPPSPLSSPLSNSNVNSNHETSVGGSVEATEAQPPLNAFWNPPATVSDPPTTTATTSSSSSSSALGDCSSVNPSTGVKVENWGAHSSTSSNGPLRSYVSTTSAAAVTYTPCSSNSSNSLPGLYDNPTAQPPVLKKELVSPSSEKNNGSGGAYLTPTDPSSNDIPPLLSVSGPDSGSQTPPPLVSSEDLQYSYARNTSTSSVSQPTIGGLMWSGQSGRPGGYYRQGGRYDQVDAGGGGNFYSPQVLPDGSVLPMEPENLDETLEEIAELEGELSSEEENEMVFANGNKSANSPNVPPFEGINFSQLFSASIDHSEKLIALAREFYPKLKEMLLMAANSGLDSVGSFLSPDNGVVDVSGGGGGGGVGVGVGGMSGFDGPADSILCNLSSMLENYLFHMVEWVNRTEIFRVIRVEDKMQLLYSSWSEVIVIEFLQCVILNLRVEDRVSTASPQEPSNRDLYYLVKDLMDYLLPVEKNNNQLRCIISRFCTLGLSSHEFTCLKFLVIFNPFKHDVRLTTSMDYVSRVQAELCHFLLRAARRSVRRRSPSTAALATLAASERLGQLLSHLAEVKHVAFQLENFLVARYHASYLPDESLLAEMLLGKRGSRRGIVRTHQPRPPPQQPSMGYDLSGSGFQQQQQQQQQQMKGSNSSSAQLPPTPLSWPSTNVGSEDMGGNPSYNQQQYFQSPASTPSQAVPASVAASNASSSSSSTTATTTTATTTNTTTTSSSTQDQSFYMSSAAPQQQQQQQTS